MLKVISWYKIILNFGLVKAKWRVDFMNEMTFKPLAINNTSFLFFLLFENELKEEKKFVAALAALCGLWIVKWNEAIQWSKGGWASHSKSTPIKEIKIILIYLNWLVDLWMSAASPAAAATSQSNNFSSFQSTCWMKLKKKSLFDGWLRCPIRQSKSNNLFLHSATNQWNWIGFAELKKELLILLALLVLRGKQFRPHSIRPVCLGAASAAANPINPFFPLGREEWNWLLVLLGFWNPSRK